MEKLTDKEAICLLIVFLMGSSMIIGTGGVAKNDIWIALIVGALFAVPMMLVYSRILQLFPGQNMFDVLQKILGKAVGSLVALIYIWFAFHLGSLVLRNFGEFINAVAMPETPILVPLISLGIVCIVAATLGIEVTARTSTFFLPIEFFIIFLVLMMSIQQLDFTYLKPVLANGLKPVLQGGFSAFSFPFAESVLLMFVLGSLKTRKSPYRIYFLALLITVIVMVLTSIRNVAMLGGMLGNFYFPTYSAVGRITVGEFIQRIEVTVAFTFVIGVYIKTSVCLMVACKGISSLLHLKNYRSIVIQIGILMIYFSYIVYDNIMEMKEWAFQIYDYYAFPMQVVLPLAIWLVAEWRARKANQQPT